MADKRRKAKVKFITMKVDPADFRPRVAQDLPKALFDRLESVLRREVAVVRDHFKKRGHRWNLSWRCIEERVYQEVFGDALSWYVLGRFLKAGCTWTYRKNSVGDEEPMLVREPKRRKKRVRK